jgi:hypothetical protein
LGRNQRYKNKADFAKFQEVKGNNLISLRSRDPKYSVHYMDRKIKRRIVIFKSQELSSSV